jgi:hypothetical protein
MQQQRRPQLDPARIQADRQDQRPLRWCRQRVEKGTVALPIGDFLVEIVAGGLLSAAALSSGFLLARYRRFRRRGDLGALFGLGFSSLRIVHSAIFDPTRNAYNWPASDVRAVRYLTGALEAAGYQGDADFSVVGEPEVVDLPDAEHELWQGSMILLCGPKRNKLTAKALDLCPTQNYSMEVDEQSHEKILRDLRREVVLLSTQDSAFPEEAQDPHDYGYILSFPSPRAAHCRITVVAGIHGPGSLRLASSSQFPAGGRTPPSLASS